MLTRAERQEIIEDYMSRHNGKWDPRGFRDEVKAAGDGHRAWSWFMWNKDKAADEYQIWQARQFVRGVTITRTIETIERGAVVSYETEMPLVFSRPSERASGGGYAPPNPSDPDSMGEYCSEAHQALENWLERYSSALIYAGGKPTPINKILSLLWEKVPRDSAV